jgi:hypothetical protein
VVLLLTIALTALLILPAPALGQTATGTPSASPSPSAQATPMPQPALTLSSSSGLPGAQITANGSGFQGGETVDVSFNGQPVGTPKADSNGDFALTFTVPNEVPDSYGVLAKGQSSNDTASTTFTIKPGGATLTFNPTQASAGASETVTAAGFQPGETVQLSFNGPVVASDIADTNGAVTFTFNLPNLAPGQYGVTATGETSGVTVNETFTIIAGPAPAATAAPTAAPAATATPAPAPAPQQNAPAVVHDERFFGQTGFRIDNDDIWGFFQQYGGIATFGYPVSRTIGFLGCPVQMFQRQIIQDCPGQGAALINLLDPDIFPYTQVNGSTFPAPDPTIKSNTPPVSSPTYSTDIMNFVAQVVPNDFGGQPVGFLDHFNSLGGLTIWGAPISNPQPDPNNANFIYQRFQRGIMHFIAGTGTESVLLADFLKAIMMNENVPPDLLAQSRESRFFNQYCPGQTMWLCRPADLPGTDLTFAFVQG